MEHLSNLAKVTMLVCGRVRMSFLKGRGVQQFRICRTSTRMRQSGGHWWFLPGRYDGKTKGKRQKCKRHVYSTTSNKKEMKEDGRRGAVEESFPVFTLRMGEC